MANIFALREAVEYKVNNVAAAFGKLNYDGMTETFELFEKLKNVNLDILGEPSIKMLTQKAIETEKQIKYILNLPGNGTNVKDNLQSNLTTFSALYPELFNLIAPIFAFIKAAEPDRVKENLIAKVEEEIKIKAQLYDDLKSKNDEAEKILASMKDLANESGVAYHATHFQEEVKAHLCGKQIWLGVTGFFVAVLLVICWHFFQNPSVQEVLCKR